ncbi:MAG: BTAD domain-containing putative transcriptional regulator [Actinomycetes bacterium]
MTLSFGLLGPLEVRRTEQQLALGGARPRSVLAVLLLNARRVVPVSTLLDAVWDGRASDKAEATLQVHVSALRRTLGPDAGLLVTRAPGYVLEAPAGRVDLDRFREARDRGRAAARAGAHDDAADAFRAALEPWRGRPLADLAGLRFADEAATALEEERLTVVEQRLAADLHAGRSDDLLGELHTLVADHPLREGLWHSLVLALYRSARQADALAALDRVRRLLRDELGIEPGQQLQDLHRRVLAQDPTLATAAPRRVELARTRPADAGGGPRGELHGPDGVHVVPPGRMRIGRDPEGELVLTDDTVSRRHAEVVGAAGEVLLLDKGSTNGTWVNGARVTHQVLQDGDEVRFGDVVLVYRRA